MTIAGLDTLTLEQKVRLLTGVDNWRVPSEPAIGLRELVLSDGPAGVRGELWDERDPSANVPSPSALAASWDPDRVERLGRLLAAEARRKNVDVFLAPTVNLHRSPYGGRHFECFSEDPLLTARIAAGYVRGVQGGGVAATVKHFVANDSETERLTLDARIDERTLRELYLAPFEHLVREVGAWAVMAAYNGVNGHTMTESPMLTAILKEEWGFDGLVMSDWTAARSTVATANAGLDLVMPGPDGPWGDALAAAVRSGEVPEKAIDDKVLRLVRLAERVGALAGTASAPGPASPGLRSAGSAGSAATGATREGGASENPGARASAASASGSAPAESPDIPAVLRETAAAGFVLARNEGGLLPLAAGGLRRVAVLGPNAVHARTLGGGSATVYPPYTVSPVEGIRAALGDGVAVESAPGVGSPQRVPRARPELLRSGLDVRLLAADGRVLRRERRTGPSLVWLGSFGGGLGPRDVATIEIDTILQAGEAGTYRVGATGTGTFEVHLGDREPATGDVQRVDLAAGERVPLRVRTTVQGVNVWLYLTIDRETSDDEELDRAAVLAARADAAIVVVGTTEEVESEGFDRDSLALPGRQDDLVRRVVAANPNTVVVVNSGAPVLLPWRDEVPAVLLTWFPGQEFGNALADVLFGATEPGGRLPVVWPAAEGPPIPSTRPVDGVLTYAESIHIGQRAYDRAGIAPAYPFGHGLGYTSWEYTEVTEVSGGVLVWVRNSGTRAGREVVQVYASRPDSGIERPSSWLVGFAGVTAEPGEEVLVEVPLAVRAFQHWDAGTWRLEPGEFRLAVGHSATDVRLTTAYAPTTR